MRLVPKHFLILGLLTGTISIIFGTIAVGLTSHAWPHILQEEIVLLCIIPPLFELAFAWIAPVRRDGDSPP